MKQFGRRSLIYLLPLLTASVLTACATPGGRGRAKIDAEAGPSARQRKDTAPKVGDAAPLFTLKMLNDESKKVELAGFFGDRPVVLFFGSYT